MSIDFNTFLTPEEKHNILTNKIKNFAAEAYQIDLNKVALEKNADSNQDAIKESENSLVNLAAAIDVYQAELELLTNP
jgi:ABC-type uncharacterized transport system involved in gliding motility auxiliary subunit